ncbi:MAG: lactonase family protein [Anaerolineae bacterium]|nr:lactonase family protein [Anaerolineae bacterium]MCI0610687.1 lactonase family protein [Anaerolineae bacterium]
MSSQSKNAAIIFVGTYTESDGSQSEGIYAYRMDPFSGQLTFESVVKGIINPAFLEIHPHQNFLYAVNEVESFNGQAGGGVSAFSIHSTSDEILLLNEELSHGEHPCYVSIEMLTAFFLTR